MMKEEVKEAIQKLKDAQWDAEISRKEIAIPNTMEELAEGGYLLEKIFRLQTAIRGLQDYLTFLEKSPTDYLMT